MREESIDAIRVCRELDVVEVLGVDRQAVCECGEFRRGRFPRAQDVGFRPPGSALDVLPDDVVAELPVPGQCYAISVEDVASRFPPDRSWHSFETQGSRPAS